MNATQKEKFEQYENNLKKRLDELENDELALGLIEYNPKKDGTARQNFADNFAIRGLGTTGKYASGNTYRLVDVKPVTYNGYKGPSVICLDITVQEIDDPGEMRKAGIDRPVKYVNDSRFAFSIYGNCEDMPTDTTAEQYVKAIHEQIIPGIRRKQEQLRKELKMYPEIFKKFVEMANMYHAVEGEVDDTDWLTYVICDLRKDIPVIHD